MAKITVVGDAVIVTSSMKLEDLKTIQKYRPQALVLKGGEDGKEAIFRLGVTEGVGNINKYGAEFTGEARDGSGLATITLECTAGNNDIKNVIVDEIGYPVAILNKLEAGLPEVLSEVKAEREAVVSNITFA